jgi:hypothetical protein
MTTRAVRTVENHGQRVRHVKAGTVGVIIGSDWMLTRNVKGKSEPLYGFKVKDLASGAVCFLPYKNLDAWEALIGEAF